METFFRFLYEFLSQFFDGVFEIIKGLISGIKKMFDIKTNIFDITFVI